MAVSSSNTIDYLQLRKNVEEQRSTSNNKSRNKDTVKDGEDKCNQSKILLKFS